MYYKFKIYLEAKTDDGSIDKREFIELEEGSNKLEAKDSLKTYYTNKEYTSFGREAQLNKLNIRWF